MPANLGAVPTSPLILIALGICAVSLAVLFSFPSDPSVWQAATWTLVGGLGMLLPFVVLAGGVLAVNPGARTWSRIGTFILGLACLLACWVITWQTGAGT